MPSAPTGIVVPCLSLSVRPYVCPERHYLFNSSMISAIGLKFGGTMHNTMKQIAV